MTDETPVPEKRPRKAWTSLEDEVLKRLYAEGRPVQEIADELGVKPSYVRVRAHRLAVRRPPIPMEGRSRPARKPKEPSGGLAARLATLQGLSVESEASEAPIPDATLLAWLDEPEAFFSWLGISLFPYQKEALALVRASDRACLVWPRQHGKDMLTALYGLWAAICKAGAIVVCVSPSQRQSDLWADAMKAFALSKKELRDSVTDLSQSEVAFSNGSRVYSLPSGTQGSATIRGFSRVSLVVANEAAWIAEETFNAVQPFVAVSGKGAKLILASTPFGQTGYLWRAFNGGVFARHHVTSVQNPLIPADFIEKERATMDPMSFAAEWNAAFISGQSSYFPTELVQRCVQSYHLVESPLPEHGGQRVFLGADWARVAGADKSVLTVLGIDGDGHGKVLWIKAFDGVDYVQQAGYVSFLQKTWRFERVYSDASNHAVNDLLRSHGVPIEPIQFTAPSKVELFGRLRNAMEAGRLTIPQHPDLLRELSTFEYKISEAGNLLLHHVTGGHDDYPDSLALAAKEVTLDTKYGFAMSDAVADVLMNWGGGRYIVGPEPRLRAHKAAICVCCGFESDPANSLWVKVQPYEQFPPRRYWCPDCRPEKGCKEGGPHKDEDEGSGGIVV